MQINKVYNENCLDTMSRMPNEFIDLTVTSPPYDNLRTYNGYSFDFESIAKELYRVTKEGGVVVWVVGDATINGSETGSSFRQALFFMECGYNLHDTMIYNRQGKFPNKNRYWQDFEYMFVFSKGKPNNFNPLKEYAAWTKYRKTKSYRCRDRNKDGSFKKGGEIKYLDTKKNISNVWKIKTGDNSTTKDKIAYKHPAIFPEKLANDHIISWSNEEDLVYDPFMGSGTTAKMAIANNRNWIGSEISSEYCDIIHKRTKQTKLL